MSKLYNRVKVSTATTGTGTITLGSAVTGYQTFASAGVQNGDVVSYVIEDANGNVEFGTGTYTSTGTTLSRTVVQSLISGTWGTTAITLSGTAEVFISPLADDIPANDSNVTLNISNGGTGKTTAPAANAALMGFTSTATAGGTTTLTNTSSVYQIFTGTSNQTVQLPATSTLAQGWSFHIVNNSTGTLTVQTSTAVSLGTVPPGVTAMPTALTTSGNTATDWEYGLTDFSTYYGTGGVLLGTSTPVTTGSTATITAGYSVTSYNIGTPTASSTVTPNPANGNYQYLTNNAAFTLAVPGSDCAIDILVTNGSTAGAITISGSYTAPSGGGGDTYATTNGLKFILMIRRINNTSTYFWKALQ